ncbi:hypothetical protein LUZ60_017720 [Juncus effusus]|nr:hypothetical protein LUZ60_017720 [Juncus effusus]
MVMDDIYEDLSPLTLSPNSFSPLFSFHSSPSPNSHSSTHFTPSPNSLSSTHSAPNPNSLSSTNWVSVDRSEDPNEFSDIVLTYINNMLMEESDNFENFPNEHPTVLAAQKPFLDIIQSTDLLTPLDQSPIGEENPSSQNQIPSSLQQCEFALNSALNETNKEENPITTRGRKRDDDFIDPQDERCAKSSALCTEEAVRNLFDKVLLCKNESCDFKSPLKDDLLESKVVQGNKRGRKKGAQPKEETVDLTTLLINCAQSVAIDDHKGANHFLKEIRKHSSQYGDSTQRLAIYFADGLEARLGGTGSEIYRSLLTKKTFTCDILKAYQLYLTSCPFKKVSHFFSDVAILDAVKDCKKLHIVDYGIHYGFQWPCFMQRLAMRPGGPPRLRITGIDLPQPGFRPAELVEQTGLRLKEYAKLFNVPFEYQAIASKWETIRVSDLNIDREEVLVVNCLYRLRNIVDETVSADNPRIRVLNTIRRMNPRVFVHGILHGSFGVPFFMTRFREALFHFSTLFDMLEATTSRVDEHRLLIERDLFGREALNVIACEGIKRIERPESYKQWQVKNLRAGFKQVSLKKEVVEKARLKVKKCYHRDFVVDQDNGWLLQGWKGRIIFAISAWKPNV